MPTGGDLMSSDFSVIDEVTVLESKHVRLVPLQKPGKLFIIKVKDTLVFSNSHGIIVDPPIRITKNCRWYGKWITLLILADCQ